MNCAVLDEIDEAAVLMVCKDGDLEILLLKMLFIYHYILGRCLNLL